MSFLDELFDDIRVDLQIKYGSKLADKPHFLFLFNPSHEMALAVNDLNYTPTAVVSQMERDLVLLPAVFTRKEDCIADIRKKCVYDSWGNKLNVNPEDCIPFPWGWNRAVRNFFLKLGVPKMYMPSDWELNWVREFASRRFHAKFISLFLANHRIVPYQHSFVGEHMEFCVSPDDLGNNTFPCIFKLPWSSSGRGNFVAYDLEERTIDRLKGYVKNQGGFLKDVFYDKLLDFAMEFYVFADGRVRFVGFSVFQADENGKYGGNLVDSQKEIETIINDKLKHPDILMLVKDVHMELIKATMAGKYTGFVGVDMMAVDTPHGVKCHPCVEINPRMNMGVLAMAAYLRPFFFREEGGGGSVVGDKRRSSTRTPSEVMRERGFHTCFSDRFISIRYS